MPARIPRDIHERQLRELAEADGYSFVEWDGKYIGARGKVIMRCDRGHQWSANISHFKNGTRCPTCEFDGRSLKNRTDRLSREYQIRTIAKSENLEFCGWVDEYKNAFSQVTMKCINHGEWAVSINNFVNHSRRCPTCGSYGYSQSKIGYLYSLVSKCGSMIKIGITNNIARRHSELVRRTPFGFTPHRVISCLDGSHPPMLERMFHGEFPSAGLIGFDGATEWRVWYPEVNTWFDLLGG